MPHLKRETDTIHYEVSGEGDPILFLPGIGVGGNIWTPVVEIVSRTYACVTIDTRGAGYSSIPRGRPSIADLAGDIIAISETLSLERPVVAGHSMGGFIALTAALALGMPISGLVLVSTAASGSQVEDGFMTDTAAGGSRGEAVDRIIRHGTGEGTSQQIAEQMKALILSRPLRGSGYLWQRAAVAAFDVRSSLAQIEIPCCIIHGTDDRIIPPATARRMHEGIPNATLVLLDGVGHFPIVERPGATAAAIAELAEIAFSP